MLSNDFVNTFFKIFFHSLSPVFMRVGGFRHPICRTKSVVKLSEHWYSRIKRRTKHTDTHTAHLEGAYSAGVYNTYGTAPRRRIQRGCIQHSLEGAYSAGNTCRTSIQFFESFIFNEIS